MTDSQGNKITTVEAILRSWAISKQPILQIKFIEIAFGRAPNHLETTGADGAPRKPMVIEVIRPAQPLILDYAHERPTRAGDGRLPAPASGAN